MGARKALLFEDPLSFSEFVKRVAPKKSRSKRYELFHISHPEKPGRPALVLLGYNPPRLSHAPILGRSIKAQSLGDQIKLTLAHKQTHTARVLGSDSAEQLTHLVALIQLPESGLTADQAITFWLRDESLGGQLMRDSIRLGNDRIQFARLESGDTLIRIDRPSFFLVQRYLDDHADQLWLFRSLNEHLFIRWGFRHPLEDLWLNPELVGLTDSAIFFSGGTGFQLTSQPRWEDVYTITELSLDPPIAGRLLQSTKRPPAFKVPLSLVPTNRHREAELWLLDDRALQQLESTIQIVDEEQLRPYQLTIQADPDGGELVFLRETHSKRGGQFLEFGGTSFAHFRGLPNLLIPSGFDLLPPVRRDLYTRLFELQPGVLTVVLPDGDGFRSVQFKEREFDSLNSLVTYIVKRDSEQLQSHMGDSIFDFGEYLKAPSRTDLKPPESRRDEKGMRPTAEGGQPVSGQMTADEKKEFSREGFKEEDSEFDEATLGAIQKRELETERAIVASGQSLQLWQDLFHDKRRLNKDHEATFCAIDAWWLADSDEGSEAMRELLRQSLGAATERPLEAISELEGDEAQNEVRSLLLALSLSTPARTASPGDTTSWLSTAGAALAKHETLLRAKERWFAWGAILSINHDLRRETQLREEIREQITERGLSIDETPPFIRTRIFLDRNRDTPGDGENPGKSGADAVLDNLSELVTVQKKIRTNRLGSVFACLLARAYQKAGNPSRALAMVEVKLEPESESKAWALLFQSQTLKAIDERRAAALDTKLAAALREIDPDTYDSISSAREQYNQQEQMDNPTAFLAQENQSRTYPTGSGQQKGPLYSLAQQLKANQLAGDEDAATKTMLAMMSIEDKKDYDDYVKLPQFIEELVAGLERFKWGEKGAAITPTFEQFSSRAPSLLGRVYPFYGSILYSNLARGLLVVENLERADENLARAVQLATECGNELDFIDAASGVVRSVEQLPLERRRLHLRRLSGGFTERFDSEQSHFLNNPRLFGATIKLLEQLVVASVSRDRLSLNQFKSYSLHDEYLVLQRIQRQTFCQ